MIQQVEETIKQLLVEIGVTGDIELTTPPDSDLGDIAFPCFQLAKAAQKNPTDVARDLVGKLEKDHFERYPFIQDAAPAGPYVNFYINTARLADLVLPTVMSQKTRYGNSDLGGGKKILIEYPSQNSHKEFHIGHLRNICIGNTLVALFRASGYDVVHINYINDFGANVAKCLWGITKWHATETPTSHKQRWLGEIYTKASRYLKDHPEVQSEVDEVQKKLESRDPSIWVLFETTRQWSLEGFEELQRELGAMPVKTFLESEVKDRGQQIVEELLAKGIATVGERGAIIIDLAAYNLDVAMLRKSIGAGVYLTADLALAEKKFAEFDVAESINITGIEQNFYFKQLFKVLELFGFKKKMTHIGYGLVNLPEGKMSSREGNVVLYETLRDAVLVALTEQCGQRHTDWSEEKIRLVAEKLTHAVLKFSMQQHEANKNITFNIDEAVSFDGYGAPYILYAIARINSLVRKGGYRPTGSEDTQLLMEPEAKRLLLLLAGCGEVMAKALKNYNPSAITKYCFDLAKSFNDFYAVHTILTPDSSVTQARLLLAAAVAQVLTNMLALLSIETVEEM